VSRRVSLPGADELFRATSTAAAAGAEPTPSPGAVAPSAPTALRSRAVREASRRPTGRERHDEKITVYVSPDELVDLERSRLALRADHSLAVDRGRIVREALAVVLADLEAKGADSILVRRLRDA
jgi:hypothetical protein